MCTHPMHIYVPTCTRLYTPLNKINPVPQTRASYYGRKMGERPWGNPETARKGSRLGEGESAGRAGATVQGRAAPVASAGEPGVSPPGRVWPATSWACASLPNALTAEGRGRRGKLIPLCAHPHTRTHSRSRGQDRAPVAWQLGSWARTRRERKRSRLPTQLQRMRGVPLGQPQLPAMGACPGTPPPRETWGRSPKLGVTSWGDGVVFRSVGRTPPSPQNAQARRIRKTSSWRRTEHASSSSSHQAQCRNPFSHLLLHSWAFLHTFVGGELTIYRAEFSKQFHKGPYQP